MANSVIVILALICAIAATVLAFIFIVPDRRRAAMNKFGKLLHDIVNFKFLIIEKILQAAYIFATAFVILLGFFMLFSVQETYSYYAGIRTEWMGGAGLLVMLLGPIVVRLVYEGVMMFILLIKNVIQINNKLRNNNEDVKQDIFSTSFRDEHEAPVAPVHTEEKAFCANCGTPLTGEYCNNCGTKRA